MSYIRNNFESRDILSSSTPQENLTDLYTNNYDQTKNYIAFQLLVNKEELATFGIQLLLSNQRHIFNFYHSLTMLG